MQKLDANPTHPDDGSRQVHCRDVGAVGTVRATRHGPAAEQGCAPGWLLAEVRVRRAGAAAWQRFPAGLWLQPARCAAGLSNVYR